MPPAKFLILYPEARHTQAEMEEVSQVFHTYGLPDAQITPLVTPLSYDRE